MAIFIFLNQLSVKHQKMSNFTELDVTSSIIPFRSSKSHKEHTAT